MDLIQTTLSHFLQQTLNMVIDLNEESTLEDITPITDKLEYLIKYCDDAIFSVISNEALSVIKDCLIGARSKILGFIPVLHQSVGQPRFHIPKESLEDLKGLGLSMAKIALMFGVSKDTILRRVKEFDLSGMSKYSTMTDDEIDAITKDYMGRHGRTTGEPLMSGYFRSLGHMVQ